MQYNKIIFLNLLAEKLRKYQHFVERTWMFPPGIKTAIEIQAQKH